MHPLRTLITGGNGHVARSLARRLLAQTDEHLLLWLHADSAETFGAKREQLQRELGDTHGRVAFAGGDLRSAQPFAGVEPGTIRRIVHAAAVTRFNVEEHLARDVNELGTRKLLEFADRCDALERLALLSTVYASGLRSGDIEEVPLSAAAGFANHYERSKWAAEELLLTRHAELPWQIMRIATVIADDAASGHVSQYNAFHNTLKLLYHGLLPIIPGRQDTPLYFVTSDFVAEALLRVMLEGPTHSVYHLAHTRAESLSLGELLARAFGCFEREPGFKRRRVMQPLYADEDSFARLAATLEGMSGDLMRQSVGSVRPFAKQLFLHKNVRN
jgi:nucleoside-diphosphate-sugar epimerase